MNLNFSSRLKSNEDMGILALRLFVGIRLIYGVTDNIMSWDKMLEFSAFLNNFNFPFPIVSAVVSVYFQFLAGICIITGIYIRVAASFMIFNFIIALIMVHRNDSFENMTPALSLLFISLLFLFTGSGKYGLNRKN